MRKFSIHKLLIVFLLLAASLAKAQVTVTSGTITDSDGTLWTGAQVTVQFSPNPNYPNIAQYNISGVSLTSPTYISYLTQTVATNNSGAFSVNLLDNVQITPAGSRWYFVVKSNTSAQATAYVPVLVSGGTTNLSSFLSANAIPPRFPAYAGTAYGYADLEVTPIPNPGGFYYNTSVANQGQRIWSGSSWTTGSSGGGITNNALTLSNGGSGAASGTTFNGSGAVTISYNSIGAAPLASPTFTGTPSAPTAANNTNTTQIATTAFVLGQAGTATPLINGTATVGTSLLWSRQDHIHPTDTTRSPLASPTFTGTVTTPALIISGQTSGATQCAQISSTGAVSGTGSACGAGGGGTTTNTLTINSSGSGVASGGTFNGASAIVISYNSIGALPVANPTFTGTLTGPTINTNGSGSGILTLSGSTSGSVIQTVPAVAGTSTITWGNATGTPAVTAGTPLAINASTGNITLGNVPVTLLNSGTGASASTFWRGDGTWAAPSGGSLPTSTTGQTFANIAGTPSATSAFTLSSVSTTGSLNFNGVESHFATGPTSATTVNSSLSNVSTTITVVSTTGYAIPNTVSPLFLVLNSNNYGGEVVACTAVGSGTTFTGCTRSLFGTTAASPTTVGASVDEISNLWADNTTGPIRLAAIWGGGTYHNITAGSLFQQGVDLQQGPSSVDFYGTNGIFSSKFGFGPGFAGWNGTNNGISIFNGSVTTVQETDGYGINANFDATLGVTSGTTTLIPVTGWVELTGSAPTAIANITVPSSSSCLVGGLTCTIAFTGVGFTTTTAGNVQSIYTVAANTIEYCSYLQSASKWRCK